MHSRDEELDDLDDRTLAALEDYRAGRMTPAQLVATVVQLASESSDPDALLRAAKKFTELAQKAASRVKE